MVIVNNLKKMLLLMYLIQVEYLMNLEFYSYYLLIQMNSNDLKNFSFNFTSNTFFIQRSTTNKFLII
jgi:hypothetical protein